MFAKHRWQQSCSLDPPPPPYDTGAKRNDAIRPSVRPSLSVPFSNSVSLVRRRYARVDVSNAFRRGQHGRLCPRLNAISGENIGSRINNPYPGRSKVRIVANCPANVLAQNCPFPRVCRVGSGYPPRHIGYGSWARTASRSVQPFLQSSRSYTEHTDHAITLLANSVATPASIAACRRCGRNEGSTTVLIPYSNRGHASVL